MKYDVIVIGCGAMGTAAAYHLARRDVSVLCLEQFAIGHAKGSSHGDSRKIRLTFLESELHELARRSLDLWQELEHLSGRRIVYRHDGLYLGPRTCEFLQNLRDAAELYELPLEELDRSQVAERYPQFCIPDDYRGVLDETAGILRPERAVAAQAELALRRGAVMQGHEPVVQWSSTGSGVTVKTDRSTYHAGRLLICGGAWSIHLLNELGLDLAVTRQVVGWVWPKKPRLFDLETFPGWGLDDGEGRWYYGFPMLDGGLGMKLARDWKASCVDPDTVDRQPTQDDEEDFRPCLRRFIPDANGPLLAMHVCMYTNSPDHKFIIDQHPQHENVFVACGFSGSGFKFSTAIGLVLADLAMEGRTDLPIGAFRLDRFG